MFNKKNYLSFLLPFIAAIPLIIVGTQQDKIIERYGVSAFTTIMVVLIITIIVVSFLPFIKLFKGFFGGKGYGFFWGTGKLAKQILQSGKPAIATIKSIGENSQGGTVTINDQPLLNLVLMVEEDSKPPYEVSFDTIISRSAVPQFQPGASFAVKIDRNNPQNIVFDVKGTKSKSRPTVGGEDWTEMEKEVFAKDGIDGMAKIVDIQETGKSKDFEPVIKVIYEVSLPGESSYKKEKELALPTATIKKLRACIGKSYKARVHPYNKDRMAVEVTF